MSTLCEETAQVQDVPELVPARMLNEFAYCPRLAYLEWVQGEFADNLETIEGRFGHRRVDEPSRADVPEAERQDELTTKDTNDAKEGEEKDRIHTRALMLSAPSEGLIAKMDLVDVQAGVAIPVDYKHGRVPDIPGNAWEPEQVQLCAQGLILRENGYLCEGGILYYVDSRKRISVPFDEALVERTRALVRQLRSTAARRVLPPPLDDSPKCPRCSLVGICLPDETRMLAAPATGGDEHEVRRLMPARDDALPLYVQEQGATLGKSGDQLTVKTRDKPVRQVRLLDVSQVCVLGNVQITAQALRELSTIGIPVCHFTYGGWFHAMTVGMTHKNVELRIAQYAAAADPGRALAMARQFVLGKIKNCRTLLRRNLLASDRKAEQPEDGPDSGATPDVVATETGPASSPMPPLPAPEPSASTGRSDGREVLHELALLLRRAEEARDAASLLGFEGMAAKAYFAAFARLLKGGESFNIEGRNRRPPRDPVNALLSFLYAILAKELTLAVQAAGFDPMLGFYHRPRYGRPSLALDLAEEFRPLVADSTVLTLVNTGEVTPASFVRRAGGVALTDAGRRTVLAAFERRMDTLVTHPLFGYRISYRRVLEVQARLLSRVLLGEIAEYPSFCTR
jgi:CRISPR-associated protein Cas1